MTGARVTASLPAAVLAVTAAAWFVAVRQMQGMDMGVATDLGSFRFFLVAWVSMMVAMMLPGALPALVRRARSGPSALAVPHFAVSYLVVWTVVGLALYGLYRPHGTAVAAAVTIAAGHYELTPLKRACRARCRGSVRSGSLFGLYCVGSSAGLMLVLLSVGAMSVTWMCVIGALVVGQKLVPPTIWLDVPLALALVALGVAIAAAPASIPGLTPSM